VASWALLLTAVPASAHGGYYRGHGWYGPRVGLYFGGPLWRGAPYGYGYGPTVIYAPQPAATQAAPIVYIERDGEGAAAQAAPAAPIAPSNAPAAPAATAPGTQWWYLCASPRGAYPYVRECPGGWERVPAVPPVEPGPPR